MRDDNSQTMMFDAVDFKKQHIVDTLNHVNEALTEKGYDATNQIVGYLISNDPAYISSHKGARKLIQSISRDDIVEELVKSYLNKK